MANPPELKKLLSDASALLSAVASVGDWSVPPPPYFDFDQLVHEDYPRHRAGLERADNSICKLRKGDCLFAMETTVDLAPSICDEWGGSCEDIPSAPPMTSDSLWPNQASILARFASDPPFVSTEPWLAECESGGVCEECATFYEDAQAAGFDWKDAVTPASTTSVADSWTAALVNHGNKDKLKCAESGTDGCTVAQSTWPTSGANCAAVTALADSTACDAVAGCVFTSGDGVATVNTCTLQDGPMPTEEWKASLRAVAMQQGHQFRDNMHRCEVALSKHTLVRDSGPCYGEWVPYGDAGTYMADCDACNANPIFSFTLTEDQYGCLTRQPYWSDNWRVDPELTTQATCEEGRWEPLDWQYSRYCLSYFVGLMEDVCHASNPRTCREQLTGTTDGTTVTPADADAHVAYMVNSAYEVSEQPDAGTAAAGEATSFCGYTDDACEAKIKAIYTGWANHSLPTSLARLASKAFGDMIYSSDSINSISVWWGLGGPTAATSATGNEDIRTIAAVLDEIGGTLPATNDEDPNSSPVDLDGWLDGLALADWQQIGQQAGILFESLARVPWWQVYTAETVMWLNPSAWADANPTGGTQIPLVSREAWPSTLPVLTIPGSAGGGGGIYCQVYGGEACTRWYEQSVQAGDSCHIGEANRLSVKAALDGCGQGVVDWIEHPVFDDGSLMFNHSMWFVDDVHAEPGCSWSSCIDCANACYEAANDWRIAEWGGSGLPFGHSYFDREHLDAGEYDMTSRVCDKVGQVPHVQGRAPVPSQACRSVLPSLEVRLLRQLQRLSWGCHKHL